MTFAMALHATRFCAIFGCCPVICFCGCTTYSSQVPFLPSSVNTTTTSEHNILATVSEALKRSEDPSQMQALTQLYAKMSTTTGVEGSYAFVACDENTSSNGNAPAESAVSPVTSRTGTLENNGCQAVRVIEQRKHFEGSPTRHSERNRSPTRKGRGRGRVELGAEAQDAVAEEQRAELKKVRCDRRCLFVVLLL